MTKDLPCQRPRRDVPIFHSPWPQQSVRKAAFAECLRARQLQRGRARTRSALLQASEDGSAAAGLAGGAGSCLPASFVLLELPGRGGSTLQRDSRRRQRQHRALCSPICTRHVSGSFLEPHSWGCLSPRGARFPFSPSQQGLTGQKASSLCPAAQLLAPGLAARAGNAFPGSAAACQDSPLHLGKEEALQSSPCGVRLKRLCSRSVGQGPAWTAGTRSPTSSHRLLFCSLAVPGGESPGHRSSAEHRELKPAKHKGARA